MPRKPRTWFPGAMYHITSRGIRKNSLFEDEVDRYKYLSLIVETKERYPFTLHSYCLMTNHIHLQLETHESPPEKIMQFLNLSYAKYFNKKYSYSGHVFDNRYFRELIDSVEYELQVSKYIHLNPLSAGIVKSLEDYPWSSYRTYVFREPNPLITTDKILAYFQEPQNYHYENYIKTEDNFQSAYSNLNILTNYPIF